MSLIHEGIDGYLIRLKRKNVTPITLKNYRSTLTMFARWAEANHRKMSENSVNDFLAAVAKTPETRNVYLVRLRGLASFMKITLDIDRAKEAIRDVEALDSKEIDRLVQAAGAISSELCATVAFLSETGLRYSEFLSFKASDVLQIKTDNGVIHAVKILGKGRKLRVVPLSPTAMAAVPYLPVCTSKRQAENLAADMKLAGAKAELQFDVHPHLLRASFISIMLNERNVDAVKIAKIVGHASPDTLYKHYYRASITSLWELVA